MTSFLKIFLIKKSTNNCWRFDDNTIYACHRGGTIEKLLIGIPEVILGIHVHTKEEL